MAITGSVTSPKDLAGLVESTVDEFSHIDAVVNNTGHPPKGDLLEIPDEDWHSGLDLLLLNVLRMARLVTPIMQSQGGGAIVNISTFSAFEPSLRSWGCCRVPPQQTDYRAHSEALSLCNAS